MGLPIDPFENFIGIIFPAALCTWVALDSNTNKYLEYFLG